MKMSEKVKVTVNKGKFAVAAIVAVILLTLPVKAHAQDSTQDSTEAWDSMYQNLVAVSMAKKAQAVASATNDLILVDEANYTCGVFCKLQEGGWYLTKTFPIAIGKASTPTPCGRYTVQKKIGNFDLNGYRFWYATWFEGFGIHSTAYEMYPTPKKEADASISKMASNGCIRMSLESAKWIYDNVSDGTEVMIYNSAY